VEVEDAIQNCRIIRQRELEPLSRAESRILSIKEGSINALEAVCPTGQALIHMYVCAHLNTTGSKWKAIQNAFLEAKIKG
jgi:hypothetical protein